MLQDNDSVQQNVQTGPAGVSDDDSVDPIDQDEEELDVSAPVRGSSDVGLQPRLWAIRQIDINAVRNSTGASGSTGGSSSGRAGRSSMGNVMYLEPPSLRRSTTAAAIATVPRPNSMATTASGLARAFGLVIRQIADLLTMLMDYSALAPTLPRNLEISQLEGAQLHQFLEFRLKPVWDTLPWPRPFRTMWRSVNSKVSCKHFLNSVSNRFGIGSSTSWTRLKFSCASVRHYPALQLLLAHNQITAPFLEDRHSPVR